MSRIGAVGRARWRDQLLRSGRLLRRRLIVNDITPRLARVEASAPAAREKKRGSAEVLSTHLPMSRPVVVAGRRIAAAVDETAAAAVVAGGPCTERGFEVPADSQRRRAVETARGRSSCGPQVAGAAVRGGHLPGLTKARRNVTRAADESDCRSTPPLRHARLLRRQLIVSERVPRLAKRNAVAPAPYEGERNSAEVLSMHLAMNRPAVVAERRNAAAVDKSAAAAVEVTAGPACHLGHGEIDKVRRGRAMKPGVDGRRSSARGVAEAAVCGGHLPGLIKVRMKAGRAARDGGSRSVRKSEADGFVVEAPTTRGPPWPRRRVSEEGAEQANATARPWNSGAQQRAMSITVVRATLEGGRQLIRKPLSGPATLTMTSY